MERVALIVASVVAGALAVPLDVVATPASAAGFGLFAVLGLFLWRWSRLQQFAQPATQGGLSRFAQSAVWMATGLTVGLFILAVMRLVIEPVVPEIGSRTAAAGALPVWRRALIIYVAAVGEELIFRLFLLSVVAGIAARVLRRPQSVPTPAVIWTAIVVSALLFGVAHLPSWSGAASVGMAVPLLVVALNAVGGIVLGRAFVYRGIAAAIWIHAGADCAIQLIGPLTG